MQDATPHIIKKLFDSDGTFRLLDNTFSQPPKATKDEIAPQRLINIVHTHSSNSFDNSNQANSKENASKEGADPVVRVDVEEPGIPFFEIYGQLKGAMTSVIAGNAPCSVLLPVLYQFVAYPEV
jgi:hypothetical protein